MTLSRFATLSAVTICLAPCPSCTSTCEAPGPDVDVVACGELRPRSLLPVGEDVWWVTLTNEVRSAPRVGGDVEVVSQGGPSAGNLVRSSVGVHWPSGGSIATVLTPANEAGPSAGIGEGSELRLAASGERVFWVGPRTGRVGALDTMRFTTTVLTSTSEPHLIVADSTKLYFTRQISESQVRVLSLDTQSNALSTVAQWDGPISWLWVCDGILLFASHECRNDLACTPIAGPECCDARLVKIVPPDSLQIVWSENHTRIMGVACPSGQLVVATPRRIYAADGSQWRTLNTYESIIASIAIDQGDLFWADAGGVGDTPLPNGRVLRMQGGLR